VLEPVHPGGKVSQAFTWERDVLLATGRVETLQPIPKNPIGFIR